MAFMLLTPICIAIAIIRFNLFDIDRLISATATYSILLVFLAGGGGVFIPSLSQASSSAIGMPTTVGQILWAALFAVALSLFHRPLHSYIDRRFFPERYALQQGVKTLLREIPSCRDPLVLFTLVGFLGFECRNPCREGAAFCVGNLAGCLSLVLCGPCNVQLGFEPRDALAQSVYV